MIAILDATPGAIARVGRYIRPADELEIQRATNGMNKYEALELSCAASQQPLAVHPVFNREVADPVALFGVVPDQEYGVLWMVTTPMLLTTSKDILKEAGAWLDSWRKEFSAGLHNLVDAENAQHIKWIKKMGGKFDGAAMRNKALFLHFSFEPIKPLIEVVS